MWSPLLPSLLSQHRLGCVLLSASSLHWWCCTETSPSRCAGVDCQSSSFYSHSPRLCSPGWTSHRPESISLSIHKKKRLQEPRKRNFENEIQPEQQSQHMCHYMITTVTGLLTSVYFLVLHPHGNIPTYAAYIFVKF